MGLLSDSLNTSILNIVHQLMVLVGNAHQNHKNYFAREFVSSIFTH
jgi:hypothetical protein